jgi:hypothetical protein
MVLLFNMKFERWEAIGMFVLWLLQFTSMLWEGTIGMAEHTVRHYSIFVNLGWTVLEVFLALIKVRHWDFPFRIGARRGPASPYSGSS